jgi:hypothetical protein
LTYARYSLDHDGVIADDALAMLHALGGTAERWRRATVRALTHTAKAIDRWPTKNPSDGARRTVEDEVYNNPMTWPLSIRTIELCHAAFETLAVLEGDLDKVIARGEEDQAD